MDADLIPALLAPDMPKGPGKVSFLKLRFIFLVSLTASVWNGRRNPDAPAPIVATRSSKDHAAKRVFWSHAFSSASIREYQPVLGRRALQLAEELEKRARAEESVNLAEWMSHFAYVWICSCQESASIIDLIGFRIPGLTSWVTWRKLTV